MDLNCDHDLSVLSNSIVIPFHCNYNKHPDIWPNCPPRISSGEQSGHSFSCRQDRCEASIVSCTIHTYIEDSYCVSISCGQVHRFQINLWTFVSALFICNLSGYPRLCCAYHLYGDIMYSKAKSSKKLGLVTPTLNPSGGQFQILVFER